MAGTIPGFSLAQQLDSDGTPLVGCKLYTIQAGTTSTPQTAYQDSGLTLPWPYPVLGDAYGRLPQIFLADGSIKLRLTRANDTQVFALDGVLVVGASSGGGGGSSVDATTIFQTGDVMWLDVDGVRTGWVRDNGRTIGSATSGATERANADTLALYAFLWNTYSNTICPVSTGRGASPAADYAANKTIATPNKQGLVPGGLDGMGNTASSVWANVPVVSGSATTSGSVVGASLHTLTTPQLPVHSHANSLNDIGHSHRIKAGSSGGGTDHVTQGDFGGSSNLPIGPTGPIEVTQTGITITNANAGSGSAHNNTQTTVLGTFYRKL